MIHLNGISDPRQLVIGQAIVIPTPRGAYVVQPGDTLYAVAKGYGTSATALAALNQIQNPDILSVGQKLKVPKKSRRTIEANAYLTDVGSRGEQVVRETASVLTYLSPFSYHVGRDGSLVPLNDTQLINLAKNQTVSPLLVISNWEGSMFSSDLAHVVLNSDSVQQRLIDSVLTVMKNKGHKGLNIDFEYVYPDDREVYNQFLQKVVTRFHSEGYTVSTALAPKLSASQQGLLYTAHDYPVHGRLCDYVVLMSYEWGWIGGKARAVSPVDQIRKVLDYAVTAIPRRKILMGVSVYGYDWKLPFVQGSRARTLTPLGAVQVAARNNVPIRYSTVSQAPHYDYKDSAGSTHQVWFEDPRSFRAKLDLVSSYRLRGISFWSYPTSFPQVPAVLSQDFRVRKF
ncbi:LysM peptidoglycan-binding domain-containing protein [Alicyclobacillus sp. SO9]|nr:LysM peptidoglycan-binding domain-containing protein [Alicyclobacillus sp. SO9]